MNAAREHQWEQVEALLPELEGVDINELADVNGDRLVHFAAASDERIIRKLAEEYHCDLRHKNGNNRTPLDIALRPTDRGERDEKMVEYLFNQVYSPVERLVRTGLEEVSYDQFVAQVSGATADELNVSFDDQNGVKLVHILSELCRWRELKHLSEMGKADMSAVDSDGNTLVHTSVMPASETEEVNLGSFAIKERECLFRLIIKDLGLDVNGKNKFGDTAAHYVVEQHYGPEYALEMLKVLKELHGDMTIRNESGQNMAMLLAERYGAGPWIDWAISDQFGGCDPNDVCNDDKTYTDYLRIHLEDLRSSEGTPVPSDEL